MTEFIFEISIWKRVFKSKKFWKRVLCLLVLIITVVSVLIFTQSVVAHFQNIVLQRTYDTAIAHTKVFLNIPELQGARARRAILPNDIWLLYTAIDHVEQYDAEYAIICRLLDSDYNILTTPISHPAESGWQAEPFNSPDVNKLYAALASTEPTRFSMTIDDIYIPFYTQWIRIGNEDYCILLGIQSEMVWNELEVNRFYIPLFCFGIVLLVSMWITVFSVSCNWHDKNARTRKGAVTIEREHEFFGTAD